MKKIEKLTGEYNSVFTQLSVIESELTKECQNVPMVIWLVFNSKNKKK